MNLIIEGIYKALSKYYPERKIQSITDRGMWIHHHYEVSLDNGDTIFFKVGEKPEWNNVKHVANVVNFFSLNGISAPRVLAVDSSCSILPYPYIIQEKVGGIRLYNILKEINKDEQVIVYETIGKLYKKIHSFKNERSGLWGDEPRMVRYHISPNDYMYNAEILNGSGKNAFEKGLISERIYNRVITVWESNIDYLKNHQSSLIHVSPFLWNIYLQKDNTEWNVTKLMSLGDVMWWDIGYDIAEIQYPSFGGFDKDRWAAFIKGYGVLPERKRILLYAVMQRLCAVMGTYMEPKIDEKQKWVENRIKDIALFLDEIESL